MSDRVEFKREIGLFMAVMIGIGAMMGPGIFALPGELAKMVGPLGIVVYLAMGVVIIFTALNYAELGAALPIAGGGYSFVSRTLPKPIAFLTGSSQADCLPDRVVLLDRQCRSVRDVCGHLCAHHPRLLLAGSERRTNRTGGHGSFCCGQFEGHVRGADDHHGHEPDRVGCADRHCDHRRLPDRSTQPGAGYGVGIHLLRRLRPDHSGRRRNHCPEQDHPASHPDHLGRRCPDLRLRSLRDDGHGALHRARRDRHTLHLRGRKGWGRLGAVGRHHRYDHGQPIGV
ncbi:MAG: amino acid permease [Deltaproteobacteria bacterium]|nr:amino acid permease [Deltaproteobacteria bacterium]